MSASIRVINDHICYEIPTFTPISISCEQSPHNISPIIDEIIKRKNWLLERLPEDVPIIIIMGETHTLPMHAILLHGLLAQLNQDQDITSNSFAFGKEIPHDILESLQSVVKARENEPETATEVLKRVFRLAEYLQAFNYKDANFSKKNLVDFCIRNYISTSFNDASTLTKNNKNVLSKNDPHTANTIKDYEGYHQILLPDDIPVLSHAGMNIRNYIIADRAINHIEETKAKVYVQQSGSLHVFGEYDSHYVGLSFQDSLTDLFRSMGYATISVLPTKNCNIAIEEQVNSIFYHGLSDDDLFAPEEYKTSSTPSFLPFESDFRRLVEENSAGTLPQPTYPDRPIWLPDHSR